MDLSEFTANYTQCGDDELLCLWADRNNLVPEAIIALEKEIGRRGLKKENATRVRKRLDDLAAREAKRNASKSGCCSEVRAEYAPTSSVGKSLSSFHPAAVAT